MGRVKELLRNRRSYWLSHQIIWWRKSLSLQRKCKWNPLNWSVEKFQIDTKRNDWWCYILGNWGVVQMRIHFSLRWNQFGDTCVWKSFVMWYLTISSWDSCNISLILVGLIRIIFAKWELLRSSLPEIIVLKQGRNGRRRVGEWWQSRGNLPHITRMRIRLSGGSRMWSIRRRWCCSFFICWFYGITRWYL